MIGIIGTGAIASAIVKGLCDHGGEPDPIVLSPRNTAVAATLANRYATVTIAADTQAVLDRSSMVILCLRPQDASRILPLLHFSPRHAVISVMAGVSVSAVRRWVTPAQDVSRAIPLPAVSARDSDTPVFPAGSQAAVFFAQFGRIIEVADEAAFEAFSAATGTVAAYFAYLQAIGAWLAAKGIPEQAGRDYVASTYKGLLAELGAGAEFERLALTHTTPGGINEQFRGALQKAGLFDAVTAGLNGVLERLTRGESP